MEVHVAFKLFLNKSFHRLKVFLIKCFTHEIQDHEPLLMRDGAEFVSASHVKHGLDNLFAEQIVEAGLLSDGATSCNNVDKSSKLLHGTNSEHTSSWHHAVRLIAVSVLVSTAKQKEAVVAQVLEVRKNGVQSLIFAVFEEAHVLFGELGDQCCQEVECIRLVL